MKHPRRKQSGHTLVELLVVTTLMSLLTTLIAQAWRPIGKSTAELRATAVGLSEMRLALDFLRQDLGCAQRVMRAEGAEVRIEREGTALARFGRGVPERDPGVTYALRAGQLLRTDLYTNETFAVARDIRHFQFKALSNGAASLELKVQDGDGERSLELIWSR